MTGEQARGGWAWSTIGEAGEVRLGRQRSPKHQTGANMVPYLRVANVFENRIELSDVKTMNFMPAEQAVYLLEPGDILLNEGQSPHLVGRPAMYRGELAPCFFQNTLVRFRARPGVLPGWALLVFRAQMHARRYMRIATITTNIAHLGAERFSRVEFPIPPLAIQERTVAQFEALESRLDAAVASLTRAKANVKRARASVLKAAVEGRLVPTEAELARAEGRDYEPASVLLERILAERKAAWVASGAKGKYKEPVKPGVEGLPELPEGWCWASAEELSSSEPGAIGAGPFGTIFKARDFRAAGVPIIFLRHVKPDAYRPNHRPTYMDPSKWHELFRDGYSVWGGEILVTKLGDPPGEAAIFPDWAAPAMLTPDVMKWVVNPALLASRYAMHYLNSDLARRLAFGVAFGTTRLRLTIPLFRSLAIPLPPLQEQDRIAAEVDRRLSVLDALDATLAANLARCARLRQSILKRAFEGKLVEKALAGAANKVKNFSLGPETLYD